MSFKGTFGGSPAGEYLDDIINKENNPKLVRVVGSIVNRYGNKIAAVTKAKIPYEFHRDLLNRYRKDFLQSVDKMNLSVLRSEEEKETIRCLTRNVITAMYRKATVRPDRKAKVG